MYKNLRTKRHMKIRKRVVGMDSRPRLAVFRSGKHIFAQMIDDLKGVTIVAESDLKMEKIIKKEKAYMVGKKLAEKAKAKKIKSVVFDRGGFLFHGRIKELARGAREGGLEF
ncbi:50S ribosomal protein L18 [Candidatus Daviesbacteria bacterium RIFCSPHIGHO2_12_FULL_37_11]|uniref:Large ribosomal subunit protein uL18 n=1 Tax=Candidatus Daviesbacteria bacterium RIFCSPHIGHO2_12_FULL_37_11 TaxID=1797777 RepID=A0A1F5KD91_9BACT|nr:MAG: 50S ribosomal protein L18 [Candidatus Daviesbacteria bacterium RIFCSPHIGHO2_01_FULL_37_27]OGE38551.1 MAG: 50S ribosomal protein L18 [Candidatus Daviesbacteria bacterium RIFCSPHIGHO2_12_FULL_37_11]